jgi:hypothetical protein
VIGLVVVVQLPLAFQGGEPKNAQMLVSHALVPRHDICGDEAPRSISPVAAVAIAIRLSARDSRSLARGRNQCTRAPRLEALTRCRWHSGLGWGCRPRGQLAKHTTPFPSVACGHSLPLVFRCGRERVWSGARTRTEAISHPAKRDPRSVRPARAIEP